MASEPQTRFACSACGKMLRAACRLTGKVARCPQCGTSVTIPQGSDAPRIAPRQVAPQVTEPEDDEMAAFIPRSWRQDTLKCPVLPAMETRQWHYRVGGREEGPIAEDDLAQMFHSGRLRPDTMVWTQELTDWAEASSVAGLIPTAHNAPLPAPPPITPAIRPAPTIYAGFCKRFAAVVIDIIIVWIATYNIGLMFGYFYGVVFGTVLPRAGLVVGGNMINIICWWLYCALLESSATQASVGKMALGIKVTDLNGSRMSFGRATGRHFAKIISILIVFIGFLMVAFTPRKRGLHDMIAGCLVVNK